MLLTPDIGHQAGNNVAPIRCCMIFYSKETLWLRLRPISERLDLFFSSIFSFCFIVSPSDSHVYDPFERKIPLLFRCPWWWSRARRFNGGSLYSHPVEFLLEYATRPV